MVHCLLYLCVVQLVCITSSTVYHVIPDINDHPPEMNIWTLDGLLGKTKHFDSNTEIYFLPGIYHLLKNFTIDSAENIFLSGNDSTIKCNTSVGLVLVNVTNFTLGNITFINCRRECSQHTLINISKPIDNYLFKDVPVSWHTAVLLYHCELVTIVNVSLLIEAGNGVHALVGISLRNLSKFYNIQVIISCSKSSNILMQLSSVTFSYYNSSITTVSTIIIDNFQFMVTTPDNVHTPVAIALEVIVLKQLVKVEIILQNTNFIGLHNSIAVFYYAESCVDEDAKISLILDNTLVYNNHADFSLAMFYIILRGCGFVTNSSSGCYGNKHGVHFMNNNFEGNRNLSNVILIFLQQTLVSSVNIVIHNCSVFDNTDTHFIVTKSEIENLWQITHRITLSVVNITHNKHKNGLNLLSFMHGHVSINNMVITKNSYYDSIIKISFAEIRFQGCVVLSNNTAYRLIDTSDNSYFIAEEPVILRIDNNTCYNVINFADWEDNILELHDQSEGANTCQLQFSSPRGNLDDEFKENSAGLHYNIMVSNNTFVLPGYLMKFESDLGLNRNCSWLAKTSFKTTEPYRTAKKFINISNSVVMQSSATNVIPSKICQCFTNDNFTCNTRQLGPVYPGQTLKVNLTVPTLASSNALALMTVRILSNSEEACLINNLSETYQLKSNHGCQEYYYTIKHHTFKTCELYLRT